MLLPHLLVLWRCSGNTHVDYVVDFPLNYLTAVMIVDKKVFAKLSREDQKIVREIMTKVYEEIDEAKPS